MYINLYLQYAVLMLSTCSVVYVAAKKLMNGFAIGRMVAFVLSVLYSIPFALLGVFLYRRYGTVSCDEAFLRCKNDLWALGTHLDLPHNLPCYQEGWTEYYVVNIIIFIVLYLLVLLLNWWVKKAMKD